MLTGVGDGRWCGIGVARGVFGLWFFGFGDGIFHQNLVIRAITTILYLILRAAQKYLRHFTAKWVYAKNFYLFQGLSKSKMETRPPPQASTSHNKCATALLILTHRTSSPLRSFSASFR
jgi:hypothetical protein